MHHRLFDVLPYSSRGERAAATQKGVKKSFSREMFPYSEHEAAAATTASSAASERRRCPEPTLLLSAPHTLAACFPSSDNATQLSAFGLVEKGSKPCLRIKRSLQSHFGIREATTPTPQQLHHLRATFARPAALNRFSRPTARVPAPPRERRVPRGGLAFCYSVRELSIERQVAREDQSDAPVGPSSGARVEAVRSGVGEERGGAVGRGLASGHGSRPPSLADPRADASARRPPRGPTGRGKWQEAAGRRQPRVLFRSPERVVRGWFGAASAAVLGAAAAAVRRRSGRCARARRSGAGRSALPSGLGAPPCPLGGAPPPGPCQRFWPPAGSERAAAGHVALKYGPTFGLRTEMGRRHGGGKEKRGWGYRRRCHRPPRHLRSDGSHWSRRRVRAGLASFPSHLF